jgi:hypothetical protein
MTRLSDPDAVRDGHQQQWWHASLEAICTRLGGCMVFRLTTRSERPA